MLRSVLTVFALIAALSCPVLAVDGMIEPTVQPLDMRSLQRPEGDGAHDSGHSLSETCSQKGIADMRKRQATLGGIDQTASATGGVQAYSTTVTYTSWTFYATAMPETTTLASSEVTTSTVITVFASDSFHALNSLLSAGQSVINSASSAAAQALATASLPASIEASTTADSTMPPSTSVSSPTSTSSIILSSSRTTASAQTGAASVGAARHDQRVILALAVVLANI